LKYEQMVTIDEVDEMAKNSEENMKKLLRPYVQSMAKTIQFLLNISYGGIKNELSHGVDH